MEHIVIPNTGDASVLECREAPLPIPVKHEVRIQVAAAGVNYQDIQLRQGRLDSPLSLPITPGHEVSGVITALGPEVDKRLLGREVFALLPFGGYASEVVVPKHCLWLKPEGMSFEQAAGLPMAYLSAYHALMVMSRLKPSETILIHNIGGSQGLAMLDLAKRLSPSTIIGTANKSKHAFLYQRGVDQLVDYTSADWQEEVMTLTANQGCDLIIDPIGGEHWKKSYEALKPGGRLGMVGLAHTTQRSGNKNRLSLLKAFSNFNYFNPIRLINDNKGVFGVNIISLLKEYETLRSWMDHLLLGFEQDWVTPHTYRVLPLKDAAKAHGFLESRKNTGKIVLSP